MAHLRVILARLGAVLGLPLPVPGRVEAVLGHPGTASRVGRASGSWSVESARGACGCEASAEVEQDTAPPPAEDGDEWMAFSDSMKMGRQDAWSTSAASFCFFSWSTPACWSRLQASSATTCADLTVLISESVPSCCCSRKRDCRRLCLSLADSVTDSSSKSVSLSARKRSRASGESLGGCAPELPPPPRFGFCATCHGRESPAPCAQGVDELPLTGNALRLTLRTLVAIAVAGVCLLATSALMVVLNVALYGKLGGDCVWERIVAAALIGGARLALLAGPMPGPYVHGFRDSDIVSRNASGGR
ncbi:unnamed protein product [Prorocentrum cordatum]|uniref:Solute carrier family 40 protein n=1 Tax=Prorocentrum cordatum TaxID=2364126 RepID=A0ABN9SRI1_9DINO|nr:unnamed protein product [Polarella glacialis]